MGAIVAVFVLAVFYEGLKTLRELLLFWDLSRFKPKKTAGKDGLVGKCSSISNGYEPVVNSDDDHIPATSK